MWDYLLRAFQNLRLWWGVIISEPLLNEWAYKTQQTNKGLIFSWDIHDDRLYEQGLVFTKGNKCNGTPERLVRPSQIFGWVLNVSNVLHFCVSCIVRVGDTIRQTKNDRSTGVLSPPVGIEPTTTRLKAVRSACWAREAYTFQTGPFHRFRVWLWATCGFWKMITMTRDSVDKYHTKHSVV